MIRTRDITRTIAWVDASRVAPAMEAVLRPTGRGRPRQLTVRALLVGLKLAVDSAKTACLTDVFLVLTEALPRSVQEELGVRDRRTGTVITLPQVRRLLDAIKARYDPSPHSAPQLSPDQRTDRAAALQSVLDAMLDATMPVGVRHGGGYAVDGTGTWSWARGKGRGQVAADPDAAWGVKTAKSGRSERYFGYELHAVVRVGRVAAGRPGPCLAERVVVVPASTNSAEATLPVLAAMRQAGLPISEVVADRGYTYKLGWNRSLRALDIDSVLDLHATQFGPRGESAGARILAGVPHCPATPELFDTIPRPERLAASVELDAFVARIETREPWALRRVAGPDQSGTERYECPARAGKLRCPLVESSMARSLSLPKVLNPPVRRNHRCCSQRTVTIPGEVDDKSRQRHYWGSRTWIAAFSRRSRVEGWFGNLKDSSREALGRGAFRVMGLCKSSLMLGIFAVATNMRLLAGWEQRSGRGGSPPVTDDTVDLSADPAKEDLEGRPEPSNRPPPTHSSTADSLH